LLGPKHANSAVDKTTAKSYEVVTVLDLPKIKARPDSRYISRIF